VLERLEDRALPANFALGDVFIGGLVLSTDQDYIRWYHPDSTLVQILDAAPNGLGVEGSVAFDSGQNLYAAENWAGVVSKFDNTGTAQGTFGSAVGNANSIVFDAFGNAFVGQVDGNARVLKFDPNGNLLATYSPALQADGTDYLDLAPDQRTLFYTSAGDTIKRFDVINNKQLPDFATGLPDVADGLVLLPDGGLLVADNTSILRLDKGGSVIKTYNVVPQLPGGWVSLALDPDGHSFWAIQNVGTLPSGNPPNSVYEFDIGSGHVENSFVTTPTMDDATMSVAVLGPAKYPMAILPSPDQNFVEGGSPTVPLGAFTDTTGFGPWNVTVNWGDGSADTSFQVTSLGSLGSLHHSFDEGSWTVKVTVTDTYNGNAISNTFQVNASEPAVLATGGFFIKPTHGVPFTATVATFTDPGGAEPDAAAPDGLVANHYLALIDWGDSSSFGMISYNGTPGSTTGVFTVTGTHTYMTSGIHAITVNILHELGGNPTMSTAVSSAEEMAVTPANPPDLYEGTQGVFDLGSFVDPNPDRVPRNVDVDWGDGTPDTTFSASSFQLGQQKHTFGEEGTKTVTVTVTNTNSQQSASANFDVAVQEYAPVVTGGFIIDSSEGVPVSAKVATFTDPGGAEPNASDDPGGQLSAHYSATIDWGDNAQSAGVITYNGTPGSTTDPFTVTGSHTYTTGGTHFITVHVFHESDEITVYSTDVQPVVVQPGNPQNSDEGSYKFVNVGSFSDALAGALHQWKVTVDWDDGSSTSFNMSTQGALPAQNHRYAEEGLKTVTVTVTDSGKFSAYATFQVNVAEVAVVAKGNRSLIAARAAPFSSPLLAGFTDPAGPEPNPSDDPGGLISDHYQALIDWGDNTPQSPGVITRKMNLFVVAGAHTYVANGDYPITIYIHHEGMVSQATDRMVVQSVVNHAQAGGDTNALVIGASAVGSVIRVLPVGQQTGASTDTVKVVIDNTSQGTFTGFNTIAIFGQGGNDDLAIASGVLKNAWIFGGGGNDIIKGGGGNNILVDGTGSDAITGGSAHDLIISGGGMDLLTSVGHGDIMIAGWTDFDDPSVQSNTTTLRAVMNAWTAAQSYPTRAAHVLSLLSTSGANAGHVHGDAAIDLLTGGPGLDLFLASVAAEISGRHAPEEGFRPQTGTPF
jgi:hypothetical protein